MFCRKLVVRYRKLTYNDILLIHVHVILLVSVAKNGACVKRNFLMINLMQEELTSRKPDTNWNNCFMWQVNFILMLSNYTFTMFNVYIDISYISLVLLTNAFFWFIYYVTVIIVRLNKNMLYFFNAWRIFFLREIGFKKK